MAVEDPLQGVAQVAQQMETVGDLHGFRRTETSSFGIAAGAVTGDAEAAGGALEAVSAILAGLAQGCAEAAGSVLEATASLGPGAASASADASGAVVGIAASVEAGEAFGEALFETVDEPGTRSRDILAGAASGDALVETVDDPVRQGGRDILGGVASGTTDDRGFDFDFDFDFDGTTAAHRTLLHRPRFGRHHER